MLFLILFMISMCLLRNPIEILFFTFLSSSFSHGFVLPETSGSKLEQIGIPNCSEPVCRGPLSPMYCHGKILALAWHYFGSHYSNCTGSKLKHSAGEVMDNFRNLSESPSKEEFSSFCHENFEDVSYLESVFPVDWVPRPPAFKRIEDENYRKFALSLNKRWKFLTRRVRKEVETNQNLYPAIYVPNNFVIPGGSFGIYFYWDSFWIAKGLLACSMDITVLGILQNFAVLVKTFGYIPNAGLIKLSSRSQPPVFSLMVWDYYQAVKNLSFVKEMLPYMDREFEWWTANRTVSVELNNHQYILYQYRTKSNCPRPEAYLKDISDAQNSTFPHEYVWSSKTSACESGWDFSSRWLAYSGKGAGTLSQIMTRDIVPVDLNSFMCKNLAVLASLHELVGNGEKAREYKETKQRLERAIEAVFWEEKMGIWLDYDLKSSTRRNRFYPSNFFPLYSRCFERVQQKEEKVWQYVKSSGAFGFLGGVPTSLNNSGQQWDFPNAWPPLVHTLIEAFESASNEKLQELARNLSSVWIRTNFEGFSKLESGPMWEKYDVRFADGRPGGGGEYQVQEGFGWTNGVVLDLLLKYGHILRAPQVYSAATVTVIIVGLSLLLVAAVIVLFSLKYCWYRQKLKVCRENFCFSEEGKSLLTESDF